MHRRRIGALIVFASVASGLNACKARDEAAADSAAAVRADSAGGRIDSAARANASDSARRADSANATRNGWTEPSILGFTWAANNGEIQMGQLGAKKATNAKVKAFAQELVTEHRAMLSEGKTLAGKLNATADTVANDVRDLINHGRDEVKDFTDKAAGADWDKDFINKMIDDHKNVLDKLQDAAKNTSNADLRTALEKATGKVQQHLTKAQDIKANVLKD
jgi:putative membrane protein